MSKLMKIMLLSTFSLAVSAPSMAEVEGEQKSMQTDRSMDESPKLEGKRESKTLREEITSLRLAIEELKMMQQQFHILLLTKNR